MARPEKSHGSRPAAIFYSLNRRYRVVRRFGVYAVQRSRRDGDGKNTWRNIPPAQPLLGDAVEACGAWGHPYVFIEGIGWT